MSGFSDFIFEAELVARSIGDYFSGAPLRLGVTGLSRAGKTVFLTALVNNLIAGASLPVLAASAEGRIVRVRLEPQPDDAVPRFAYEEHLKSLSGPDRHWPESTRRIAQLRLTIEFESAAGWGSRRSTLTLDIVDYPGEWLLDLPLLDKTYAEWSRETLAASETPARAPLAAQWRAAMVGLDPEAAADEDAARRIAELFTAYLKRARDDVYALSTLPPGRFLMPGDLAGSPALTFAPIPLNDDASDRFRFASGHDGAPVRGLQGACGEAFLPRSFRPARSADRARRRPLRAQFRPRCGQGSRECADRGHARLPRRTLFVFRFGLSTTHRPHPVRGDQGRPSASQEPRQARGILRALTAKAIARAEGVGAEIDVIALAAVRATREAEIRTGGETLDAIIGVPEKGETIGGQTFDGVAEAAVFPGELPADPDTIFEGDAIALPEADNDWRFVRFRPPLTQRGEPAPQIRLDRALQFLIGDRLA